jgi:hypothetical protein
VLKRNGLFLVLHGGANYHNDNHGSAHANGPVRFCAADLCGAKRDYLLPLRFTAIMSFRRSDRKRKTRQHRRAFFSSPTTYFSGTLLPERRRALRIEPLEDRRVLSATVYVAPAAGFADSTNPGNPQAGDTVNWLASGQFAEVDGLTFGTSAFTSIQAAVNAAGSGDTIDVAEGTYSEEVAVGLPLTLAGADAAATIVQAPTAGSGVGVTIGSSTGTVTVESFTVTGFSSGIYVGDGAAAQLSQDTISNNSARGLGGGIFNAGVTLAVSDCTITDNSAGFEGGGILNTGGTLTVSGSTISNNSVTAGLGGGIANEGDELTVSNCTVSNNSAGTTGHGGGIFNESGTLTVSDSTVSNNSAGVLGLGGGIDNDAGLLTVSDSTVSNNSVSFDGLGAGIVNGIGTSTISGSTVSNNSVGSSGDGGGIVNLFGTVNLANTIVAGNSAGGSDPDIDGNYAITDHNLIGNVGDATGLIGHGNIIANTDDAVSLGLGPLANNGGPTQTIALLSGSPAIDAGDNAPPSPFPATPSTDQRGIARIVNGKIDIGAFEAPRLYVANAAGFTDSAHPGSPQAGDTVNWLASGQFAEVDGLTFGTSAFTSIQAAVDAASSGETIDVADGTYSESISIGQPLTLDGADAANTILQAPTTGSGTGVAIHNTSGTVILQGFTVTGFAFGVSVASFSDAVVSDDTLINNHTGTNGSGQGGGIHNEGTLTVRGSTVSNNTAFVGGGGVYNSGTLSLIASTIADNSANGSDGGGVQNDQGNLTVTNCTIVGNSATNGFGGGIASDTEMSFLGAAVTVTDSTITGNSAVFGGGISTFGNANLANTIIAANSASSAGSDVHGFSFTTDHDVVGELVAANAPGFTTSGPTASIVLGTDSLSAIGLGPLQDNGGPTPTMALLPGSPAIDAGDNAPASAFARPATDQRGLSRIFNGTIDVGAFETQPSASNFTAAVGGKYTIQLVPTNPPNQLIEILGPGGNEVAESAASITPSIIFSNASGQPIQLIVDSTNGAISAPITFDGGLGTGSSLVLQGGTATSDTYSPGPNGGQGTDTLVIGGVPERVGFSNLTPVYDSVAGDVTVTGTNGNDAISYLEGNDTTGAANTAWGQVTVNNLEAFNFTNKTALTINAGAGTDTVDLNNPNTPAALASINVNGSDPAGNVTLIAHTVPSPNNGMVVTPTATGSGTLANFYQPQPLVTYADLSQLNLVARSTDFNSELFYLGTTGDDTFELTPGATGDSGRITGSEVGTSGFAFVPVTFSGFNDTSNTQAVIVLGAGFGIGAGGGNDIAIIDGTSANDTFTIAPSPHFADAAAVIETVAGVQHVEVQVDPTRGVSHVILRSLGGNDVVNVTMPTSQPAISYSIEGNGPSGGTTTLNYTAPANTATTLDLAAGTITAAGANPISFTGVTKLNVNANGGAVTVNGDGQNDAFTYTPEAADEGLVQLASNSTLLDIANLQGAALTLDPGSGTTTVTVDDAARGDDFTAALGDTTTTVTVGSLLPVSVVSADTGTLLLNGTDSFVFTLTGSGGPRIQIAGDGGSDLFLPVDGGFYEIGGSAPGTGFANSPAAQTTFTGVGQIIVDGGGAKVNMLLQGSGFTLQGQGANSGQVGIQNAFGVAFDDLGDGNNSLDLLAGAAGEQYRIQQNADWNFGFVEITDLGGGGVMSLGASGALDAFSYTASAPQRASVVLSTGSATSTVYDLRGIGTLGLAETGPSSASLTVTNANAVITPGTLPDTGTVTTTDVNNTTALLPITYTNIATVTASGTSAVINVPGDGDNVTVSAAGVVTITNKLGAQNTIDASGYTSLALDLLGANDTVAFLGDNPALFSGGVTLGGGASGYTVTAAVAAAGGLDLSSGSVSGIFGGNVMLVGNASLMLNGDGATTTMSVSNYGAPSALAGVTLHGDATIAVATSGTGNQVDYTSLSPTSAKVGLASGGPTINITGFNNTPGNLTLTSPAGVNALDVLGSSGDDQFQVSPAGIGTRIMQTTAGAAWVPLDFMGFTSLAIAGGAGSDTFAVAPSATVPISIDGGDPVAVKPGDTIEFVVGGPATYYAGPTSDSGGLVDGANQPVSFVHIETVAVSFAGGKATPTVSVSDAGGTYNGSPFPATATVAGVVTNFDNTPAASLEGVAPTFLYYVGNTVSGTGSATAPSTAGTYTVVASFAGSADYSGASAQTTFTIDKATPTVAVTDTGGTYNGSPFAASATVTGVSGTPGASLEGVAPTFVYYVGSTVSGTGSVNPPVGAGTYTVVASFAGSPDYTSASAQTTFTIGKATPTVSVTDTGGAYNGSPFLASATVTGVNGTAGVSLEGVAPTLLYYVGSTVTGTGSAAAPIGAGAYTVVASFAGSPDYTSATDQTTFTIGKATPNVAVTDVGGTYNGSPFPATATVTGVSGTAGISLEGVAPTLLYYVGSTVTGTGSAAAPVGAGTYTVVASFAGSPDYTSASDQTTFTIGKATPTVSVTDVGGTYNGSPFPATATVTGVSGTAGVSLEGVAPTFVYYVGSTISGTGSTNAPVGAGTYTVVASFAGSPDYAIATDQTTFTIDKATPTVSVTDVGGTYNGSPFPATATVTGVSGTAGVSLEGVSPTLVYYAGNTVSGGGSAAAPIGAGTYTVVASFAGSPDYASATDQTTFTIDKATPTVSVTDVGGTYNGSPFPATVTVAGVSGTAGVSLEGVAPTLVYYVGSTVTGSGSAAAPIGAGTYTAVASFAGSPDYTSATDQTTFTIGKATPTVSVTDAGGTYNGSPFPATATMTGVSGTAGVSLEGVAPTFLYYVGSTISGTGLAAAPAAAGTYTVVASFAGSPDYTSAADQTTFTIAGAAPTITSANAADFAEGSSNTVTIAASGLPTPTLAEAGALPGGVTFVDNHDGTATLSGTPAAGTHGTYQLTISAHNGVSPDATQSFALTVSPASVQSAGFGDLAGVPGDGTIQTFVDNLYRELLGREPDAGGSAAWANLLRQNDTAAGRAQVVADFMNSAEYKAHYVTKVYEIFLGRAPDAGGLQFWTGVMGQPGTPSGRSPNSDEQFILAVILGSDEFYADSGNTAAGFANALYHDLLGRSPAAADLAYWAGRAQGASAAARDALVLDILNAPETEHLLLDSFYPDPGGDASHPLPAPGTPVPAGSTDLAMLTGDGWENLYLQGAAAGSPEANDAFFTELASGVAWDDVQLHLLASDQFYTNPNRLKTL